MLTAEKYLLKQLKKTLILLAILVFSLSAFALVNNAFAVDTPILSDEDGVEDTILTEVLPDADELLEEDDKINEDIVPTEEDDEEASETSDELPIEETDESEKDDTDSELPETEYEDDEGQKYDNGIEINFDEGNKETAVEDSIVLNVTEEPQVKAMAAPQAAVASIQSVPDLKQAKVIIKCIEKGTNKVLKTKEIEGTVGATLTIYAEKINGYKAEKDKTSILVLDGSNAVTLLYIAVKEQETVKPEQKKEVVKESTTEYVKKGIESIVKINYVDAKGNTILKSKEVKSISGNVLTAYAEKIDGYAATKQKETITVKSSGSTITFVYKNRNVEESEKYGEEFKAEDIESFDIPQTGDSTIMLLTAVIVLTVSLGCVIVLKKRYNYSAEN